MMESIFGQMLTGATEIWLAVAYVAGMFLVHAFRPGQIRNRGLMRRSYLVFAASIVTLPLTNLLVHWITAGEGGRQSSNPSSAMLLVYIGALVSRLLYAVSVIWGLSALLERDE